MNTGYLVGNVEDNVLYVEGVHMLGGQSSFRTVEESVDLLSQEDDSLTENIVGVVQYNGIFKNFAYDSVLDTLKKSEIENGVALMINSNNNYRAIDQYKNVLQETVK